MGKKKKNKNKNSAKINEIRVIKSPKTTLNKSLKREESAHPISQVQRKEKKVNPGSGSGKRRELLFVRGSNKHKQGMLRSITYFNYEQLSKVSYIECMYIQSFISHILYPSPILQQAACIWFP